MSENELNHTQPVEFEKKKRPRKKFLERRSSWFLLGLLLALLIMLLGSILGIPKGINDRVSLAETQASPKIQAQLEAAKNDIAEGRFSVALDRLNWILEEMASFMTEAELEEVGNLYSQTLLQISLTGSPTPIPSPTPTVIAFTPTPDLRGEEEIYSNAHQYLAAEEWDLAIQTLEALREKNIGYKTIQVDGMLYVALRNRGVQKILVEGSLEPGIYDLTLAEQFAPLDSAAEGFRTWTRMYLTGASYWAVNWEQVVFYFEQVYPMLPNLRDGTFMTAKERFRIGAIEYANQLTALGDACTAMEYFDKALSVQPDESVQALKEEASEACFSQNSSPPEPAIDVPSPQQPVPTTAPTKAPTAVPTEAPTEEPTEEPTQEPTQEPTVEP